VEGKTTEEGRRQHEKKKGGCCGKTRPGESSPDCDIGRRAKARDQGAVSFCVGDSWGTKKTKTHLGGKKKKGFLGGNKKNKKSGVFCDETI